MVMEPLSASAEASGSRQATSHANALVVGEAGILLRGRAGAGKTNLTLLLVAAARREGRFARLVADDRTRLRRFGQEIVAVPHPRIAGLVERRGLGIERIGYEPACVLRLVVDLLGPAQAECRPPAAMAASPRLPEAEALVTELLGVTLPLRCVPAQAWTEAAIRLILDTIAAFRGSS
jgi:serine kinase of HPr protein (carbohydrate metabolism regulator)